MIPVEIGLSRILIYYFLSLFSCTALLFLLLVFKNHHMIFFVIPMEIFLFFYLKKEVSLHGTRHHAKAIRSIQYDEENWHLMDSSGMCFEVALFHPFMMTTSFILLHFKKKDNKSCFLLLFKDAFKEEDYRRLRFYLRK